MKKRICQLPWLSRYWLSRVVLPVLRGSTCNSAADEDELPDVNSLRDVVLGALCRLGLPELCARMDLVRTNIALIVENMDWVAAVDLQRTLRDAAIAHGDVPLLRWTMDFLEQDLGAQYIPCDLPSVAMRLGASPEVVGWLARRCVRIYRADGVTLGSMKDSFVEWAATLDACGLIREDYGGALLEVAQYAQRLWYAYPRDPPKEPGEAPPCRDWRDRRAVFKSAPVAA